MTHARTSRQVFRSGFSVMELLVVMAILSLLAGLLLAAVQRVREAADRLSCQNRLRQIALALHSYHHDNSRLPTGQDSSFFGKADGSLVGLSWLAKILPYVEQDALCRQARQALMQDFVPWHNPPILAWQP